MRAAVVDVGSNSTRLLLLEALGPGGAEGERITTVTGLRRGAAPDGTVTPEALERLGACLDGYAARIVAAGSPPVVAVGTSAVRDAPNREAVVALVRDRLGADLEVVDGRREAALAFRGARLVLADDASPCRVLDIGGGSTEVVQGDASGPRHSVSLALGVNRQGDLITADPPPPADVAAVREVARGLVGEAAAGFPSDQPLVGVAGTVTTVAAVLNGRYDPDEVHGMVITRDQVDAVLSRLAAMDDAARRAVAGLHPDRANVIVPGLAILCGALEALGAAEIVVSERDILDGIALAWDSSGPVAGE
ncbi:MAG: hypothetical protein ACKORG_08175 [Actinomycetota bacterium]